MTYHPSYTHIGHFMGREAVYCNMNSNTVEGVGLSCSKPGSAMGRETVYLCYDLGRLSKAGEIGM